MRIKTLSPAVDDLHAGRGSHQAQEPGLGEHLFDSLLSDVDSLLLYAGIHQKVFGYHRLLSKRFPHAAYYKMDDNLVIGLGILDLRRRPLGGQAGETG